MQCRIWTHCSFANTYMQTIPTLLFVVGFSLCALLSFIILTDVTMLGLLIAYFFCVIFGFYLNYDVRRVVRYSLF